MTDTVYAHTAMQPYEPGQVPLQCRIGWNNFADDCDGLLFAGTPHRGPLCHDAAQQAGPAAILYGCALHAAIGRAAPHFVEIGVDTGGSTRVFWRVASLLQGTLTSIDTRAEVATGPMAAALQAGGVDLSRWDFRCGYSQDVAPVQDADLLLVDGDHRYEAVCSDMARHGVAVRGGGLIILDDVHIQFPGKLRWVLERWTDLQPLLLGPYAIIVKRADHDAVFTRVYPPQHLPWPPSATS